MQNTSANRRSLTNLSRIAIHVEQRVVANEERNRYLDGLSEGERLAVRAEHENMIERVSSLIDAEAIETEDEGSSYSATAEDGYESAIDGMLPRDSKGNSYLVVVGDCRRLLKVNSLEYFSFDRKERSRICRETKYYFELSR